MLETPKDETTELYRHFDAEGCLLYVGISNSAVGRLDQHMKTARWANEIATITIERFPSRDEAVVAESAAIKTDKPTYNRAQNLAARAELFGRIEADLAQSKRDLLLIERSISRLEEITETIFAARIEAKRQLQAADAKGLFPRLLLWKERHFWRAKIAEWDELLRQVNPLVRSDMQKKKEAVALIASLQSKLAHIA